METASNAPSRADQTLAIAKKANRALAFAVLGLFVFPPLALVGWFFGHQALKVIKRGLAGFEHRGAAQFAVVVGCYSLVVVPLLVLDFVFTI